MSLNFIHQEDIKSKFGKKKIGSRNYFRNLHSNFSNLNEDQYKDYLKTVDN